MVSQIIQQGAEAIIEKSGNKVLKRRIEKSYRIKSLDEKIRKLRTRGEGKIIEKASKIIPAPKLIKADEKTKQIEMEFVPGEVLSKYLEKIPEEEQKIICEEIGEDISKLHAADIIHGDLTPSNMILSKEVKNNLLNPDEKRGKIISLNSRISLSSNQPGRSESLRGGGSQGKKSQDEDLKIYFIDFGLSYISPKIEDKAVDLHLLREAIEAGFAEKWKVLFDAVKKGYQKNKSYSAEAKKVLERFTAVERRGRYKKAS